MGYLACPVCERESLADVSDLQQRVASALNRPLSCPICSASVNGIQAFHHHLAAHLPVQHKSYPEAPPSTPGTPTTLGLSPYPVTNSPEGIPTLEHLEINDNRGSAHSPSVHGMLESPPALLQEPQSPSSVSSLTSSNKVTQPHNCDLCGLIFSSEHFLKFHKDIIHSKRDYFDVTCKLCKEKFKDFESYRDHVRENHSDRRYICDQCPKTFKMKGSLLVHTRMFHDPSSPGTCQLCKKTFTTKARKELHEKRYHGVGLEHIPTGKISPPSPSSKQQKTKTSSLGEAKSWLETLMIETRSTEDNNRFRELQDQQTQNPMQHLSLQPPATYSCHQTSNQHSQMNVSEEQIGNPYANCTSYQQQQQQQQEQKRDKGSGDLNVSHEMQHMTKIQPPESEPQQMQKWNQDFQHFGPTHEKVNLPKNSPESQYQQQKACITLPNQTSPQPYQQSRPRNDYNDFKQDKKFPVLPHGGDSAGCRSVGLNHTQQSPVAIVSPQPQKSETPPAESQHSSGVSYHSEIRRNSFPLMNVNKIGIPQSETMRQHPSGYISDLALSASVANPCQTNQNMCMTNLGDKIPNNSVGSQHLVYQQTHNIIPTINTGQSLVGPDSKVGVKVSPLIIPSTAQIVPEKVKEPPASPIQMMQVQEESSTTDMTNKVELPVDLKTPQDIQQDQQRYDVSQIRRQVSANISATVSSTPVSRKENTGKTDSKQWECDVCKKCFTTKYFLKKHKRLHTGETPYACAECGKTFTFQQSYHKHILYHSDDKPHQCSYCGRAFKEMSTLHNHVRIHTGEKPFVCENCGKAFRQRVSYLVHQRIHTGVMPYSCDACGRSFRYKVSLRSHKCEPSVASSSGGGAPMPRSSDGIGEVRGESGTSTDVTTAASSTPPSTTPIILLPQADGTTTSSLQTAVVTSGGNSRKTDAIVAGGQLQHMDAAYPTTVAPSSSGNREIEATYLNNNNSNCHINNRQQQLQQQQSQLRQKVQRQQQQDIMKHHPETSHSVLARTKNSLETIDMSAISCDGLPQENKKSANKSSRSPSQSASPRSAGVSVTQGYHDPLSVAFLHALVDPQQGRLQSECRPHTSLASQDGLPFPSLSPGSMDTDLDHDNFLTNLLM